MFLHFQICSFYSIETYFYSILNMYHDINNLNKTRVMKNISRLLININIFIKELDELVVVVCHKLHK